MATVDVRFYSNFSKRENSTKQPSNVDTYTEEKCLLKNSTSVLSPELVLSGNHYTDYTYAYIPDFNRYYFVSEPTSDAAGLTTIQLKEDYLASHKTAIGNTVAYVAYSSTGYNINIVDNRLVSKTTKTTRYSTGTTTYFSNTGCYALSIIGSSSSANGFADTYIMDGIELAVVCANLMSLDIDDRIIKALYSPFDSVISCTWLPIDYNSAVAQCNSAEIYFGDHASGITGAHKLVSPVLSNNVNIPHTPRYTDFRAMQPYTSYALYIPNYGLVDLNASDIRAGLEGSNLPIGYGIDIASGDMSVVIGNPHVQTLQFNIGVSCPIAQTSTNMSGSIGGAAGTVGGIAGTIGFGLTGNVPGAIASAAGALASAANTALSYNSRSVSIKGGISGRSMVIWGNQFKLIEYTMDTEDPTAANYISTWGRPVGKVATLSTHSGYIQCENASVNGSMTETERESINADLNSGFYYE